MKKTRKKKEKEDEGRRKRDKGVKTKELNEGKQE